ncbi:MAG TPA: P-II family nitrogen regulator [Streptosporangiaceae bacterium]|nr:P-II family nitrogen regulator [Streptosporangiaceae bacterium]
MRLITAIVQPDKLDEVMEALVEQGARGMTATEVRGFGQQYGHIDLKGTESYSSALLPKVRLEIVVPSQTAEAVLGALVKSARTGALGDGKLWVTPVDTVVRVRTGERDNDAV